MVEAIKHALGLCGEPHISILFAWPLLLTYLVIIRHRITLSIRFIKQIVLVIAKRFPKFKQKKRGS
jgi:hypothetical protein